MKRSAEGKEGNGRKGEGKDGIDTLSLSLSPVDPSDEIPPRPEGLPAATINKLQLLRFSLRHSIRLSHSLSLISRNGTGGKRYGGWKKIFSRQYSLSLSLSLSVFSEPSATEG